MFKYIYAIQIYKILYEHIKYKKLYFECKKLRYMFYTSTISYTSTRGTSCRMVRKSKQIL